MVGGDRERKEDLKIDGTKKVRTRSSEGGNNSMHQLLFPFLSCFGPWLACVSLKIFITLRAVKNKKGEEKVDEGREKKKGGGKEEGRRERER